MARPYTEDEVKELCLRTKVKVDMTAWNCLWEAKKRFEAKGRFVNKSERFINRMYMKAVRQKDGPTVSGGVCGPAKRNSCSRD